MKKIHILYFTIIIISLICTACVRKIEPADSSLLPNIVSEKVTEETSVTDTYVETTTEEREPVAPGERDLEYEKDIVFVGDSICKGLRAYSGFLNESQVFAEGSVASWSFFDYIFTVNGGQYTGVEAIKRCQPKYIYLWFGMNDARYTNKDVYVENLKKITDALLDVSPHSKIVIVSITPICSFHKWYDDYANGVTHDDPNVRINTLNECTQKYIEGLNDDRYSYLNVHDLLIDDEGYLNEQYHSGDGLHLNPKAYNIILGAVAQNEVKADPEHIPVTTSFPYVEASSPVTTINTTKIAVQTQETTSETSDTEQATIQSAETIKQ